LKSGFREEKKNSILRSGLRPQGSGDCPLRWVGLRDELRLEFFFSCVTAAFQKDKNKTQKSS